jgi:hypothetical protein
MGTIGDLDALAHVVLETAAEALDTVHAFDATLAGAPDRQFVSPGQPVIEIGCCDQLSVYVPIITMDQMEPRPQLGALNHVLFQIQISRCIPTGFDDYGNYKPPATTALEGPAKQLHADAWALWNHLYWAQSSGLIRSLCDQVFFDGINAMLPSGGCAGWTAQLRCQLDGYQVVFGT